MAAKPVLVRRGLLDITHGLRMPSLPGAPPLDRRCTETPRPTRLNPLSLEPGMLCSVFSTHPHCNCQTDEASPFGLRSTRNRPRRAMRRLPPQG